MLSVILGELAPRSGHYRVKGKLAYAPQEAFVFPATVRENILCGLAYDEERYNQVVEACALRRDIASFPGGDETFVGERGICLSGGQKARVNLARALYVEADIYLLDDPLSAVDSKVGRHLFEKAIRGFLRDKIRILVTHQTQYAEEADKVLALNEVKIKFD